MLRLLRRRITSSFGSYYSIQWMNNLPMAASTLNRSVFLGVEPDNLDRSSETFASNSELMGDLISQLQSHINKVGFFLYQYWIYFHCLSFEFECFKFVNDIGYGRRRGGSCEEKS